MKWGVPCRFVEMVCTHSAFKLSLTADEKRRILSLATLLEKKMAEREGHPMNRAKLTKEGVELTDADKERIKKAAAEDAARGF